MFEPKIMNYNSKFISLDLKAFKRLEMMQFSVAFQFLSIRELVSPLEP